MRLGSSTAISAGEKEALRYIYGSEENVKESVISDSPVEAVREFLSFIRSKLKTGV